MKALIAFVLLLVLVFFVAEIAREPVLPPPDSPVNTPKHSGQSGNQRVDVLIFNCPKTEQQYSAKISIRNVTDTTLESVKAVVLFNPKGRMPFEDSVEFKPTRIKSASIADASLSGPDRNGRDYDCTLVRIEDSHGKRLDR